MEFRPNIRPERGKYNFIYLLYVYVIYSRTQIFNVFFTATSFKMPEHVLKQHNTGQWHGPSYPHYSTNTRWSLMLVGPLSRNKRLKI